jgi:hypothetical protein
MKKFEAALAALMPRTDRLDRDRLMFLAGRQSLLGELSISSPLPLGESNPSPLPLGESNPSPLPLGEFKSSPLPLGESNPSPLPLGEGQGEGGRQSILTSPDQQTILRMVPVGSRIGAEGEGRTLSRSRCLRAWAWPGAFAVMSTVAAALFLMLISRPQPGTVERTAKQTAANTSLADSTIEYSDVDQTRANRSIFSLALLSAPNNRESDGTDSTYSYTRLLNQIIAKGVDSWRPEAAGYYDNKQIVTRPQTSREMMNQLLDQFGSWPI